MDGTLRQFFGIREHSLKSKLLAANISQSEVCSILGLRGDELSQRLNGLKPMSEELEKNLRRLIREVNKASKRPRLQKEELRI